MIHMHIRWRSLYDLMFVRQNHINIGAPILDDSCELRASTVNCVACANDVAS